MTYTIKEAFREGSKLLKDVSESFALDARVLLGYVTSYSLEELLMNQDELLSEEKSKKFFELIERRKEHEPIAYLIGEKEFYGITFYVNEHTLIPRPESEVLIDAVLEHFSRGETISVLDLGTGSGCLILTLLSLLPNARGIAIDASKKALQIAEKNALKLKVQDRIRFVNIDWKKLDFKGGFDLIVSNPPYIRTEEISSLQEDVKEYEPVSALDGGSDGLDCYIEILSIVKKLLKTKGLCILECGAGQHQHIKELVKERGLTVKEFKKDLSGKVRCIVLSK